MPATGTALVGLRCKGKTRQSLHGQSFGAIKRGQLYVHDAYIKTKETNISQS